MLHLLVVRIPGSWVRILEMPQMIRPVIRLSQKVRFVTCVECTSHHPKEILPLTLIKVAAYVEQSIYV